MSLSIVGLETGILPKMPLVHVYKLGTTIIPLPKKKSGPCLAQTKKISEKRQCLANKNKDRQKKLAQKKLPAGNFPFRVGRSVTPSPLLCSLSPFPRWGGTCDAYKATRRVTPRSHWRVDRHLRFVKAFGEKFRHCGGWSQTWSTH